MAFSLSIVDLIRFQVTSRHALAELFKPLELGASEFA
jgi:hypothetical protein